MKLYHLHLTCLALTVALAGCAILQSAPAVPVEQAAVAAAVVTVEVKDPAAGPKIVSIAKAVLAADTGASVALSDISTLVNTEIAKLNLPPADQVLADALVAALEQQITAIVSAKTGTVVSPSTQLAIATVCNWVIADAGG